VQTIAAGLSLRRNSLNFLRLVLALAVIVSHTWPIGGYGPDPRIAGEKLGTWAVAGFFAISGYLIANSRRHLSMSTFLTRRVLRIYPGYLVCLVVVAVLLAPLSVAIGPGSIQWSDAVSYIDHNIFLKVFQDGIHDTLSQTPYGPAWNGSLWTLIYEFLCYLAIGVLLCFAARWHRALAVAAFVVTAAVWVADRHSEGMVASFAFLGAIFFAGSVIAVFAERIPADWRIAVAAVAIAAVSSEAHGIPWLGAFPIAYLCLWLGIRLPFPMIGSVNDISYGVYIYAFPVQQLIMVMLGRHRLPVGALVLVAVAGTIPFAVASWFLVEKRALALKSRLGVGHRTPAEQRRRPGRHRGPAPMPGIETPGSC
jgi:peptidoglycan/LPS O-acetylase OafA/YrhL